MWKGKGTDTLPTTCGLAQAGVSLRMTFRGDFNVSTPQKRYRSPRLRQAASSLSASGESAVDKEVRN